MEHLRGIAAELRLYHIREQAMLASYYQRLVGEGGNQFSEAEGKAAKAMLDQSVFWAEVMKPARDRLAAAEAFPR